MIRSLRRSFLKGNLLWLIFILWCSMIIRNCPRFFIGRFQGRRIYGIIILIRPIGFNIIFFAILFRKNSFYHHQVKPILYKNKILTKTPYINQKKKLTLILYPPKPQKSPNQKDNLLGNKKSMMTFRKEIEQILAIWKFIKTQIAELKAKYSVSCRLLKRLSKNTVRYYIQDFPSWLRRIYLKWYRNLSPNLC